MKTLLVALLAAFAAFGCTKATTPGPDIPANRNIQYDAKGNDSTQPINFALFTDASGNRDSTQIKSSHWVYNVKMKRDQIASIRVSPPNWNMQPVLLTIRVDKVILAQKLYDYTSDALIARVP